MRYFALSAILLAATAVVASPVEKVERDAYNYAAETSCTTDAAIPAVTVSRYGNVETKSPKPTYKPTYEPKATYDEATYDEATYDEATYDEATYDEATYEPEPEPTHKPEPKPKPTGAPVEPKPTGAPVEPKPTGAPVEPKPTGAPVESGSYAEQCLQAHNTRRARHGASALVWDEELANHAQGVSATCVFEHSGGPYGENLSMGGDGTPEEFVQGWYEEVKNYNYGSGGFSTGTGHATQILWKNTNRLGCATVDCPGSGNFFTCNYADAGNVEGQYQDNVSPPV